METRMMQEQEKWQAISARDRQADGRFVYAVATTGVYCRPSCASRRPKRENVRFFDLPEAAEAAGFRACRRCRPGEHAAADPAVDRVRRACRFIEEQLDGECDSLPTLEAIAGHVGGSPFHLQRTFKRLLGVTPAAYMDARRLARLRDGLKAGHGVADAVYGAGYGAASRVYERAADELGMTPATFAKGGRGARIAYALTPTPLGLLLVAATETGVCFLSLGDDERALVEEFESEFPAAEIRRDGEVLADWVAIVVDYLNGTRPHPDLPLDVQGTAFQRRVWQELMRIPAGATTTYTQLAEQISGNPKARRAIARGCATNPVSLIIPCHRVLREDGGLGGYRWGIERKRALIDAESSRAGGVGKVASSA
jgi:AraC family transcriptional regulator of adaptative response/methylated-DNA-[protein]-cysteine methyltransferase